jgi:hypothetical protein
MVLHTPSPTVTLLARQSHRLSTGGKYHPAIDFRTLLPSPVAWHVAPQADHCQAWHVDVTHARGLRDSSSVLPPSSGMTGRSEGAAYAV